VTIFQERLAQLMKEKDIKQADLARMTGISTGTISKYFKIPDRKIEAMNMLKIAKALDVNSEWLFGATNIRKSFYEPSFTDIYEKLSAIGKREVEDFALFILNRESKTEPKTIDFPLLGQTAAGAGVSYGDPSYDTISVQHVPKGADCALTVRGDSMEPLIKDGSIVFVRKQPIVENGEVAVIEIDGEVVCKKFYQNNGDIELRSINPKYTPRHPNPQMVKIIGKVIWNENRGL